MLKINRIIITTILTGILIFNVLILNYEKTTQKKIVSNVNDVIDIENVSNILSSDKLTKLREYYNNTDIKAILTIDGIDNFSYPVVQTSNNDYYLNHDYYKKYDSYGSIYADYRTSLDNSQKQLIYGHSSIKKNVPFNNLESYYNYEFYNNHKYITLETDTNNYKYEIFSVYVETKDFTYMNIIFNSTNDWYKHLFLLKSKSLYSTNVDINPYDEILILQTCSKNKEYKNYSKKYLLIVSRRVK